MRLKALSRLMDSKSVAVYVVANRDYARLFSATSPEARELGNSIKYSAMEELFCELKERRVYINRNMRKDFPLMASAVYEQEQMRFILSLWDIPALDDTGGSKPFCDCQRPYKRRRCACGTAFEDIKKPALRGGNGDIKCRSF